MKKVTVLLAMAAMLSSSAAIAEEKDMKSKKPPCPSASNDFAWGIGLAGLTVITVVAGLTASMASGSSN